MSTKYWIKLYHETLDDPKMARLSDRLYRRVIECFLLAGDEHNDGLLPSLPDIAWRFRCNEEQLETELIELANIGILSQQNGKWHVTKFSERQATMTKAEYMQRKRDTEKRGEHYQTTYQPRYQPVTNSNTDKNRIDKDKEEEKKENVLSLLADAICNVARAGRFGRDTLDKAAEMHEAGITPDRVLAFGPWWSQFSDNGKPYLKNLTTFWDDFENDRAPHFVKQNKQETPDELLARLEREDNELA